MINKILHGDCLELIKDCKDESVDIVFADPPFNLNKKYLNCNDNLKYDEYLLWCERWIKEVVRVTKKTGSIFIHNIPKWLIHYSYFLNKSCIFKHWIAWNALSRPMGKSLQPNHYGILYYAKSNNTKFYEIRHPHLRCKNKLIKDYGGKKDDLNYFGPLVSDVWTDIYRVKHNKYRSKHPCQLPIHLLERIVLMSTDEGDVVLDPFMGTGTTALACKRLGRNFIGFEISKEYVDDSLNKLDQENTQSKIDNVWFSYFKYHGIVTIRDVDCDKLINSKYFVLPENKKDIDDTKIILRKEYRENIK
jgi:site-specific DNA-methyltransferase (adenine-specific)